MVNKKIKASNSLTSLLVILLMVIGIFTGMFLYIQTGATDYSTTIDSKYNDTYSKLNNASDGLNDNVNEIKDNLKNIKEAESTFQVALNGFKTLGSTLKLPVSFIDSTIVTYEAATINIDIVPAWITVLVTIGIIGFIVFLILAILKGDQDKL